MTPERLRVDVMTLDDARSISVARDWMRDFLRRSDAPDGCVEQAVLIVSELASNAVRHGSGAVLCQLVAANRDQCVLTVADFGGGTPAVVDRSVEDIGGLGLVIVDTLALAWGVALFAGGKSVYAMLRTSLHGTDERAVGVAR